MSLPSGAVVWITGLPGVGKTTTAIALAEALRREHAGVVRLDGDGFRTVMGNDLGYTLEHREENARRLGRLCRLLAEQGLVVVCATVSLFHECHAWNRAHLPGYLEVLLRASGDTLRARDQKGLYSRAHRGEEPHLMGVTQAPELPEDPDLVFSTDPSSAGVEQSVNETVAAIVDALRVTS